MESRESKALYELNKDYLEIYYSKPYQKYIQRGIHRKLSLKDFWNEFQTGYFLKRLRTMLLPRESKVSEYAEKKTKGNNNQKIREKVAVYTVIIGGYDSLKEPMYVSPLCDYFVITDGVTPDRDSVWQTIDVSNYFSEKSMSNTKKARFIKTHPDEFLDGYNYSIFVDGNFLIVTDLIPLVESLNGKVFATHLHPTNDCIYQEAKDIIAQGKGRIEDVKRQINDYKQEGFPKHYGLFETNVLVRKHTDPTCRHVMNLWWEQMCQYTLRDQLSLTYILWKSSIGTEFVNILGPNSRMNPRLRYMAHAK